MHRRFLVVFTELSAIALLSCGDGADDAGPTGPDVVEAPGAVENAPEVPGGASALRFDGSDDRVTVPYDPSFPTEIFTIGAWIKLTPPQRRASVIARGEDDNSFNLSWQLYVLPDGTLEVMLEDSRENNYCYPSNSCTPSGSCSGGNLFVADDVWHHVAVTRSGFGDLSIYVDGQREASCQGTGVPSSNNFRSGAYGRRLECPDLLQGNLVTLLQSAVGRFSASSQSTGATWGQGNCLHRRIEGKGGPHDPAPRADLSSCLWTGSGRHDTENRLLNFAGRTNTPRTHGDRASARRNNCVERICKWSDR